MNTQEENFNLIKKEILKGTLQERLGYDVYDKVMNNSWEKLPEKSREKFLAFLEREGEVVAFSKAEQSVLPS
jgi:hypothetical protein